MTTHLKIIEMEQREIIALSRAHLEGCYFIFCTSKLLKYVRMKNEMIKCNIIAYIR